MDCPVCKTTQLVMAERQGIEIDYCPQCRGVWLDRGELDKIIDRSVGVAPAAAASKPQQPSYPDRQPSYPDRDRYPSHSDHHSYHSGYPKKKKREGFLSDLFDFD